MSAFYMPNEKIKSSLQGIYDILLEKFGDNSIVSYEFKFDELSIKIAKDSLLEVISFLKDNNKFLFRQLIDITAIDFPNNKKRFTMVYSLLSLAFNIRVRIKFDVAENDSVESITSYYYNADWLEREVFDMFGIYFLNHPDLRRLLTDFGFDGFPLRKDFPLSGFTEIYFDKEEQKVKYKPLELEQEYRDFKSINPWLDKNN